MSRARSLCWWMTVAAAIFVCGARALEPGSPEDVVRRYLGALKEGRFDAAYDLVSKGMTQEEFAHEIAVTVSTVNRWENSHAEPSKLAWKAIHELARRRGVNDAVLTRSVAAVNGN